MNVVEQAAALLQHIKRKHPSWSPSDLRTLAELREIHRRAHEKEEKK